MDAKALAALILAIGVTTSAAASDADAFGARRIPAEPRVDIDNQPELCARIRTIAYRTFRASDIKLDVGGAIDKEFPAIPMDPVAGGKRNAQQVLSRADLDLDGTGQRQTVIYRDNEFNWSGDWHYSYVFPSPQAFDAAKTQVFAAWLSGPPEDQDPSPKKPEQGAQQYFPSALDADGNVVYTGNVWASHQLFESSGRYYFHFASNDFDLNFSDRALPVYRLRASGRVDVACRVSFPETVTATTRMRDAPAMKSFLAVIRRIGYAGPDRGTLHAETVHEAHASAAEVTAATRPWVILRFHERGESEDSYYAYGPRMADFLEYWSYQDPWSRREYQLLLATMHPAAQSYARFLVQEFDMPYANALAVSQRAIEGLVGSRILVPSQYSVDNREYSFPTTDTQRAAYLRDRQAFDSGVKAMRHEHAEEGADGWARRPIELQDTIEWSYGLDRLLKGGANPNEANRFGKTPLMIAAHMDRIDSIRRLLAAGAEVNARTSDKDVYGLEIQQTRRTALMYAAENASPVIIKALLDAGADLKAIDSTGRDSSAYLADNPRFTSDEISRGIESIASMADGYREPSFKCSEARTTVEHRICDDENLRVLDVELAHAFHRSTFDADDLADQRDWLSVRNGSCGRKPDADCLAEVMRTRLRYLHLRIRQTGG